MSAPARLRLTVFVGEPGAFRPRHAIEIPVATASALIELIRECAGLPEASAA
ncbi:MAG: hypothetical protein H0T86_13195 [Gemmatimonadales bacterium]|nr:hypothetical protein [Gemmatimonadales bacterium]